MDHLKNIAAIVTGGGSGMGAAAARMLAEAGAKVALWDINGDAVKSTAQEIGGLAVSCDVADEKSVEQALAASRQAHGAARILVNCAGILIGRKIVGKEGAADLDHFHKTLHVNVLGTYNTMRLVAADMAMQEPLTDDGERGVIINTASIAAFEGQMGQVAYSASKGAIVAMTLPAARDLARNGIRVMAIAPGAIETPMMEGVRDDIREAIELNVPFPPRMGKPEEFAKLVLHIVENSYLNGSVIRLDGGARLAGK
ncbi:MAG: 3-hydroxyacyl-CoA dehydrogenase [Alphaproteobacteria bacterium CG_4_9_14_3_um_filter_47_13]|nr:MAG: 3-hydroxyacyl-CoA dehydrogenase [Alphaproteobacteria bacterium CG_4_9_14_3_um_filter_47_13]